MWKAVMASVACVCLFNAAPAGAGAFSELELRWLKAISPVLLQARQEQLPLDIVVQPQAEAGAAPIAMGFDGARCQLVLSLRGNAEAQATLDRLPAEIAGPALELMAAHEVAHCRRHLAGAWEVLPAGHSVGAPAGLSPELQASYLDMQAVRREEGYADLAGLAWTWQHHPQQYAQVYDWLVAERSRGLVPDSFHDTLAWLRLAHDGTALQDAAPGALNAMWIAGLEASLSGARTADAQRADTRS
jgi:hypothetical protein